MSIKERPFEPVDEGAYFHPLTPVFLTDTSGKEPITYMVPAIYVKTLSDEEEWKDIMTNVRIGVNVLSIVLSIASLGAATPALVTALALTDIAVSTIDIGVALAEDELMQSDEGRAFLEGYNKITLAIAGAAALPLAGSLLTAGTRLLGKATVESTKNFLRASIARLMLEIEISGFAKNTLKIVEPTELFHSVAFLGGAENLWKQGVIFFEGVSDVKKGEKLIAAVYNGETIAQGTKFEIANRFKDIWKLSGDDLLKALSDLTIYDIRYPARALKSLVTASEAFKQFGKAGQKLVVAINDEVKIINSTFSKAEVYEKVMVSGMLHDKGKNTVISTATNFLEKEIAKGKGHVFLDFIENLHPTLRKRFDLYVTRYRANNLLAESDDIARAGWAGSHGEIRALDALLKKVDPSGKMGDAVFDDIIGYNRYLREGANNIQPTCVNCYYITKGIKYIGF